LDDGSEHKFQVLLRQQSVLAKFGELALWSDDLDEILTQACRLVGEALVTDQAKVVEIKEMGRAFWDARVWDGGPAASARQPKR